MFPRLHHLHLILPSVGRVSLCNRAMHAPRGGVRLERRQTRTPGSCGKLCVREDQRASSPCFGCPQADSHPGACYVLFNRPCCIQAVPPSTSHQGIGLADQVHSHLYFNDNIITYDAGSPSRSQDYGTECCCRQHSGCLGTSATAWSGISGRIRAAVETCRLAALLLPESGETEVLLKRFVPNVPWVPVLLHFCKGFVRVSPSAPPVKFKSGHSVVHVCCDFSLRPSQGDVLSNVTLICVAPILFICLWGAGLFGGSSGPALGERAVCLGGLAILVFVLFLEYDNGSPWHEVQSPCRLQGGLAVGKVLLENTAKLVVYCAIKGLPPWKRAPAVVLLLAPLFYPPVVEAVHRFQVQQ